MNRIKEATRFNGAAGGDRLTWAEHRRTLGYRSRDTKPQPDADGRNHWPWLRCHQRRPRVGSLCTGYGGLDMGVAAAFGGAELSWSADPDKGAARIIAARFANVPNLGDITAIDWRTVESVDVITAGFPCQDISAAGRGVGIEKGPRSSVWFNVMDAVRVLRPRLLIVENVAALRWRGLGRVLGDLAQAGYDTAWCSVRACDIGAPHRRERVFIAAHPGIRRGDGHRAPMPSGQCGPAKPPHPATDPRRLQSQRRRGAPILAWPPRPSERASDPAPERRGADAASRTDWGRHKDAIDRWEAISGRPAPAPIEPGQRAQPRLSARFVEWMMGLPEGWVTDLELSRTAQMRALGNGAIPHQTVHAIDILAALHHVEGPHTNRPAARTEEM